MAVHPPGGLPRPRAVPAGRRIHAALTRRRALQLGAAGLALGGCARLGPPASQPPGDEPGEAPAGWEPPEPESGSSFPLGTQVGEPDRSSAVAWTRYDGEGPLEVVVAAWNGAAWVELLRQELEPADGGYASQLVEGLLPDTWYSCVFAGPEGRSPVAAWRSPPDSGLPAVRFGVTSCTKADYAPFPALSRAAALRLAFFVHLGDRVYADQAETLDDFRATWACNLSTAGFLDLDAATAWLCTFDDHEVADDWGTVEVDPDRVEIALQAWFEHTATRLPREGPWYRSHRWSDTLELFALDTRSERDPGAGLIISETQLEWLVESVRASSAVFKFVLSSVPMADLSSIMGDIHEDDKWAGYPGQRDRVVDALAAVPNTYVISGDHHMGFVARVDAQGPGHDLFDILTGPGGNRGNPVADLFTPDDQLIFGTSARSTTCFRADPRTECLDVAFVGESGELLGELRLPELA